MIKTPMYTLALPLALLLTSEVFAADTEVITVTGYRDRQQTYGTYSLPCDSCYSLEGMGRYIAASGASSTTSPQAQKELEAKKCQAKADAAKASCYDAYKTLNRLCMATATLGGRFVGWAGGKLLSKATGVVDAKLYEAAKSAGTFTGFEADILTSSCADLDSRAKNYCEVGAAKMVTQQCK